MYDDDDLNCAYYNCNICKEEYQCRVLYPCAKSSGGWVSGSTHNVHSHGWVSGYIPVPSQKISGYRVGIFGYD